MNNCKKNIPWHYIFFLIVVFYLSHHNFYRQSVSLGIYTIENIAESTTSGDIYRQISVLFLAFFSSISILQDSRYRINLNDKLALFIFFFLVWVILSIAWADDIILTLRRVLIFLILCFAAFAFARKYTYKQLVVFAFVSSLVFLIIGILTEIYFGRFDLFSESYRFGGTLHPNHQGWNCGTLLLAAIILANAKEKYHFFYSLIVIFAFTFLIITKSRTTFFAVFFVLLLYWCLTVPIKIKILVVNATIFTILFLYLILNESLTKCALSSLLLGRTDLGELQTLSGRIPLWSELISYVCGRAITGYGYNAFWYPDHVQKISEKVMWSVPGAHNSYVDLALGVGIVGLVLYLVIIVIVTKRSIYNFTNSANSNYGFCWMMLIYYSIIMVSEVIGSVVNMTSFIIYIILAKQLLKIKKNIPAKL